MLTRKLCIFYSSPQKMSVPLGKTPVSFLQEFGTKNGFTPQYELISENGAAHESSFVIRVTVGGNYFGKWITSIGKGKDRAGKNVEPGNLVPAGKRELAGNQKEKGEKWEGK